MLPSGAGTITYRASNVLTAWNQRPSCTESDFITGEKANSFCDVLPATPSKTVAQFFYVSTATP